MSSPSPDPFAPPPRRLVYFGTPSLAVAPLVALHDAGFVVELVVSATDKRRGRGGALVPSPVKQVATELGIAVTDDPDDALGTGADAAVVVAYGRILKPHLLARMPMVNLHVSLLPRWRGAAPIERAILAGDERTGVCVMEVVDELDAGGVYASAETLVDHKTVDDLRTELVSVGTSLLLDVLRAGLPTPSPQVGEPTYAKKIEASERALDWAQPAVHLDRVVRIGGAWSTFRGKRLKVLAALDVDVDFDLGDPSQPGTIVDDVVVAADRGLQLLMVQPEGRGPMAASDWLRGTRPQPGERLGE